MRRGVGGLYYKGAGVKGCRPGAPVHQCAADPVRWFTFMGCRNMILTRPSGPGREGRARPSWHGFAGQTLIRASRAFGTEDAEKDLSANTTPIGLTRPSRPDPAGRVRIRSRGPTYLAVLDTIFNFVLSPPPPGGPGGGSGLSLSLGFFGGWGRVRPGSGG